MVSIHTVAGAANIHNRWRLKGACGGHDEIKFVLGEGKHQQMTFTAECPLINYKLTIRLTTNEIHLLCLLTSQIMWFVSSLRRHILCLTIFCHP